MSRTRAAQHNPILTICNLQIYTLWYVILEIMQLQNLYFVILSIFVIQLFTRLTDDSDQTDRLVWKLAPPTSSHGWRSTNATVKYPMSFLTTQCDPPIEQYLRKLLAQNTAHRNHYQIKSLRCISPPYKTKPIHHDIPMPSFVKSRGKRSTNSRPLVPFPTSCDMNTDSRDQNRSGQSRLNSSICKVIRCVGIERIQWNNSSW